MKVTVGYGKEKKIELNIADKQLLGVFNPNSVAKIDYNRAIDEALAKPLGRSTFDDFIDTKERIVFIVNDGTRPTPTRKVLARIYPKIKDKDIFFIVATGCHRAPTEEEWHFILGKEIYEDLKDKDRLWSHDARKDEMVYLGQSTNGTQMYLNKIVATAKKVCAIGSVEPHYFAGYTGGRKAFLPGVAAFDTIQQNHLLALHENAQALSLKGNPVHEDMMDAMSVLKDIDIFAIMTVLDSDHDICTVTAGDLSDSFYAGIQKADEVFCVSIPQKADIVISVAPYPMDIDLYQSQKALDNGKLALKKEGILIMVASCRTGIGEEGFFKLMSSAKSAQAVLDKIKCEYKLGYHKAAKMAEINLWAQSWAVSDLSDEEMRAVHLKPYHDLAKALEDAIAEKGKDATIIVLPFGSITVPKIVS
ncbi:MAG: nickel-dependent lactate racemase [Campylobacteraceae bacterium]|nr:nickel-dependent lactate racemase [Campylobacteraceae bacterium]